VPLSNDEINSIQGTLSVERFKTYLDFSNQDSQKAISLYEWNVRISSALTTPLHLFEIANRNAILKAIIQVFGQNWYVSESFIRTLPSSARRSYNPRKDLYSVVLKLRNEGILSSGKVVAELKFIFWEKMLSRSHDRSLWHKYFSTSFPNSDHSISFMERRKNANKIVFQTRNLRNRIAHHEPIFTRNILGEYQDVIKLISWCNRDTARWLSEFDTVMDVLKARQF